MMKGTEERQKRDKNFRRMKKRKKEKMYMVFEPPGKIEAEIYTSGWGRSEFDLEEWVVCAAPTSRQWSQVVKIIL